MAGCFVPGCKNGTYVRGCHLFRAPRRKTEDWKRILLEVRPDKEYDYENKNHRVCSDHFEDGYVRKGESLLIKGERVEVPSRKWALAKDAVPTIFKPGSRSSSVFKGNMQPKVLLERLREEDLPKKKFAVDTGGKCFMCLEAIADSGDVDGGKKRGRGRPKVKSTNGLKDCSLRRVSSYLEIDFRSVISVGETSMDESAQSSGVDLQLPLDLNVALCPACDARLSPVIELLEELEQIKSRAKEAFQAISKIMWEASSASYSRLEPGMDLVNKLRRELIRKCANPQARKPAAAPAVAKQVSQTSPFTSSLSFKPTEKLPIRRKRQEVIFIFPGAEDLSQPQEPPAKTKNKNVGDSDPDLPVKDVAGSAIAIATDIYDSDSDSPPPSPAPIDDDMDVSSLPETMNPEPDVVTPVQNDEQDEPEIEVVDPQPEPTVATSPTSKSLPLSERRKTLKCQICGKLCFNLHMLKRHQTLMHSNSSKSKPNSNPPIPNTTSDKPKPKPASNSSGLSPYNKACPYCPQTFSLDINARMHLLNKHRFQVFRKHLPAGTQKKVILSEIKRILAKYKDLGEGKVECIFCTRKYNQKDVELLVVQNHLLFNHFDKIVSMLKSKIGSRSSPPKDIKIASNADNENVGISKSKSTEKNDETKEGKENPVECNDKDAPPIHSPS